MLIIYYCCDYNITIKRFMHRTFFGDLQQPLGGVLADRFGRTLIIQLSNVTAGVTALAIAATRAPVIFSHSDAYALNPHPRNVPDDPPRHLHREHAVLIGEARRRRALGVQRETSGGPVRSLRSSFLPSARKSAADRASPHANRSTSAQMSTRYA